MSVQYLLGFAFYSARHPLWWSTCFLAESLVLHLPTLEPLKTNLNTVFKNHFVYCTPKLTGVINRYTYD